MKPIILILASLFWAIEFSALLKDGRIEKILLIDELGEYSVGENSLLVFETDNHLVSATLKGIKSEIIFTDQARASLYQRWFYVWDQSQSNLWFWSSDIGGHIWRFAAHSGQWTKVEIANYHVKDMPDIYWQNLPSSIRSKWSSERKSKP